MGKNSPNITLYFLSFIPAHPKGFEHNFLKSVKIFLLHLADFESGSICQRRDMNLYDLNNASLCHHAPVQGWDVAHSVAFSAQCYSSKHRDLGMEKRLWFTANQDRAEKHVCRQGLAHPASSTRQSSWAKHEAMLTGCQGRLCIISTIHFLSWTSA